MGCKWLYSCCLWGVASRICPKCHVAFFDNSYLAFSSYISFVSWWCIHTVVLILPQLGRIPILSERSDIHKIHNLSITVHVFARCLEISPSVDEILQPRYVNRSSNFRGLLLKLEMNSVLFAFMQRPMLPAARFRIEKMYITDANTLSSTW